MQVVFEFVQVVVPLFGVVHILFLHVSSDRAHQFIFIAITLQTLHHRIRDHGVDCFQEVLMHHMRVVEHEHFGSDYTVFVQLFEILEQLFLALVPGECQCKDLDSSGECSQFACGCLA